MNDPENDEDVKHRRAAFMEVLDNQIASPAEAPGVREQYDRLIGLGIEKEEVRRMMAACIAGHLWHTMRKDAYTYQDYIEDLSGLPDNEPGHEVLLPARSGVALTRPEALDDPFFSNLLGEVENSILQCDRQAKFRRVVINDSQIRSILNKVRKVAEGGSPKVPRGTERDDALASLFDELVEMRTLLYEEIPDGEDAPISTRDWVHALRVVDKAIQMASTGAGSRAYLEYPRDSDSDS